MSRLVAIEEIAEAIRDADPSVDCSFMLPHWSGAWEAEISDEQLEAIMEDQNRTRIQTGEKGQYVPRKYGPKGHLGLGRKGTYRGVPFQTIETDDRMKYQQ
jgi:hypothetical protein